MQADTVPLPGHEVEKPPADSKLDEVPSEFKKVYFPKFLYSWGCNQYGQLGRPRCSRPSVLPATVPIEDDGILPISVKQIVTGAGNTFILTDLGVVYGNGLNNIRQVGGGNFLSHRFQKLENLQDYVIEELSTLWDTCYAVTNNGIAIGWGANAYGQLGKDPTIMFSALTPVEMYTDSESPVVQIGAGQRHCVILTKKGRVLTCGDFKNGQLGRPYELFNYGAKEIALRNVKQIAVGQHHNVALVKTKRELKVYAWGWNLDGQCGNASGDQITTPTEIDFSITIVKGAIIKCGWKHSGLMLVTGELFLWGDNKLGQQGQEKNIPNEPYPKRIKNLSADEGVNDFGVGLAHTVVILKSGIVVAWGDNSEGSCGIGHTNSPVTMPLKTCAGVKRLATRVFAGYKQCFALTI